MALLKPDPRAIGQTIATTAAARAAMAVAQAASPKLVRDVQRVLAVGGWVGGILGMNDIRDAPTPLLGGLTLRQAQSMYEQVTAARVAKKNLFFIRIHDTNPPNLVLQDNRGPTARGALAGLIESRIGPAVGNLASGIAGAANSVGLPVGVSAGSNRVADIAAPTLDLLAMDVSYNDALLGDHTQLGASFVDRANGRQPIEMNLTTMDDERGSLKLWFDAKMEQVAKRDGTFGLPVQYAVEIEVVHAIPSDQVENSHLAYRRMHLMRATSVQHDLSRRDQAVAEVQMTFAQVDPFMS